MARLKALNPEETTGKSKELFDTIKGKMGMVPNVMKTMGNSPAVLSAYLGFSTALAGSTLGNKLSEALSLSVANHNGCDYCNSAHTFIGGKMGIGPEAIEAARHGKSDDPKTAAALSFAQAILDSKGKVSNAEIEEVRSAGFSEGEIAEIVASVALSVFTNYFNNVADTDIDFPKLAPIARN
ncbi:carboxymuconolactone decarboxylase family protein [Pedobacter sp. Leaf194]|uniref:carboxymuconolactone decarboxylase family protein n=1 Tax=Pedobacter sp. Leaf194 TaxID=1736297 RepID=UPI00070249BC|nr:carboxymuconolactone decarboxylase family protein [Pedobacter sp. Leaf194]KQS36431.1 peroxidase [Pedobacter sp. Leaf194]